MVRPPFGEDSLPKRPKAKAKAAPAKKGICAKTQTDKKCLSKRAAKAGAKIDKRGTPKGKATHKGGRGGQIGNPPHKPTPDQRKLANDLASYGIPQWAIAEMMDISEDTLKRHYAKELRLGEPRMVVRAANMVAKGVLAGDKDYVKFFLARRGGPAWTNKQSHEHSGPKGKPIEHRDMSGLTDAQLEALAALEPDA